MNPLDDVPRDAALLVATAGCGVVITGSRHRRRGGAGAHLLAGVITDPATRTLGHWSGPLWILLALWTVRAVAQWLQARLSQRGATAAIADLSRAVLAAVTALPPRDLAARRDDAAVS